MGYFVSRLSAITYAVLEKFVFIDFGCLFVVGNIKIRLIKTAPVPGIFLSRVGRRSEGSHVRALGLSHSVQCDVCVGGGACPPSKSFCEAGQQHLAFQNGLDLTENTI